MRRKLLIGLALLLSAAALPIYSVKIYLKNDYSDFDVYYRAAERLKLKNTTGIYSLNDGASPFRYAPVTLPLFRPMASLPFKAAQLAWFYFNYLLLGLSFLLLYRGLKFLGKDAAFITAFSVLFVTRFCLDSFTIGQVSGFIFLGFSAGLYYCLTARPGRAGVALSLPTLLKIGPGFLFPFFAVSEAAPRPEGDEKPGGWDALWTAALTVMGLNLLLVFWLGSFVGVFTLWKNWLQIVAADSQYADASSYGSQSIKSALLRVAKTGWLSPTLATQLHLILVVAGCCAILLIWATRAPRTPRAQGLLYSLGVLATLWFMPETFKFAMVPLALPVALLLAGKPDKFTWFALFFGILTLSIPGKDIVGDYIFFGLQHASAPLLATLLIGIAVLRDAWRESDRSMGLKLSSGKLLGPWDTQPLQQGTLQASLLIALPDDCGLRLSPEKLSSLLESTHTTLQDLHGDSFEILLIPYGFGHELGRPLLSLATEWCAKLSQVMLLNPPTTPGRGAALQTGFLHSKGRLIYRNNIETPGNSDFFQRCQPLLQSGCDFITGNRRLPESKFRIPVRLLPWVYRRHRMGAVFSLALRKVLPIYTTDIHSGISAMNRTLALRIFAVQLEPDLLFDVECHLLAASPQYRRADLPVTLILEKEKSRLKITEDFSTVLLRMPSLLWRHIQGHYRQ